MNDLKYLDSVYTEKVYELRCWHCDRLNKINIPVMNKQVEAIWTAEHESIATIKDGITYIKSKVDGELVWLKS